ncbi:MAG: bifunctional UDP-sugar hydrolase/5'-nucleotidase [Eubacteriales bacterium]|nr:bifunctional UDP-sugar hydrolase/5'-nucleotidase [Eubacteriales bacterium]MDD4323219.1 bifunctional UDP-sugar hydrolase/5'-nucleotidase [Eubacteriales bacterium]
MKKNTALFMSLIILLLLFVTPAAAADNSTARELTVLFTHDMHSYLDTKTSELNGRPVERGGFAKMKTIFDEISAEKNTLIVDAGDFSMGTLYQTLYTEQAAELRMLGYMGYDAVTLGNHEFDYGSDGLAEMLKSAMASGEPLPEVVMSNIDYENSTAANAQLLKETMTDYGVAEYLILQKDDVKVALFGGIGEDADKSAPSSELVFTNIVEQAKITVSEIQKNEDPNIIIYLSHAGTWADPKISEDEILAKEVPEIDLIVSGHTHTLLEEPRTLGQTHIASSGEYGQNVGKIDLIQNEDESWDVQDYELIPVDETVAADVETLAKIDQFRDYVNDFLQGYGFDSYDQVIAYSPYTFTGLREMNETHIDQALGNLISDALIHGAREAEGNNYVPVDVSVVPVGIIRATFNEGPITVSDIYEVMSLGIGPDGIPGYPLASVYLTGKELKTVAEIDASITPIFVSAQLYSSGLSYTFNPNRIILNRVTDAKLIGENGELIAIDDNKLYRVVADLYSAQMLGAVTDLSKGILSLKLKDAAGNVTDDLNDLILYDNEGNEAKEWIALASYMQSFPEVDGVPTIPADYAAAQNRKLMDDSKSLDRIFRQLNTISIVILLVILVVIVLLVLIIRFIVRRVRRRRLRPKEE